MIGEEAASQIEVVSRDAGPWITVVLDERCPGAVQCMDPFHVVAWATEAEHTKQESLDLEREERQLLEMCRQQSQNWVAMERAEYKELQGERTPLELACTVAENAAWGGLPVAGAFWTDRLLELLERDPSIREPVRRFLVRLYEAPAERRLALLDRIAALQWGVV